MVLIWLPSTEATRPDLRVLYMSGSTGKLLSHHGVFEVEVPLPKPFTKRDLWAHVGALQKAA
jgi:hypothetical protein